ncbi:MAG: alpha-keto acid decarboxylase family protein [Methanomicrobiales archaeon]|nr:alpha-keto acid decarboxylase family protein [Methanomicrobiales archaeon]
MDENSLNIGEYLIQAIYKTGTRHVFGVPGDYILNFYAKLNKSPLKLINTSDEEAAAFAADAYARFTGFGVVCVTYTVGGLKVLNATACAFAEKSPILVIAGAPGYKEREKYQFLHHKPNKYDDSLRMFERITVASTGLDNPTEICQEIDRVIHTVLRLKRPGFIELPRDMVDMLVTPVSDHTDQVKKPDSSLQTEAVDALVHTINSAKQPVIMAGIGVLRYNLVSALESLAEKTNIPIVTTILGKSVLDERNTHFLGVYAGIIGDDAVRAYVESSDCVILAGMLLTDVDMGANTAVISPDVMVTLSDEECSIGKREFSVPGLMLLHDLLEKELRYHTMSGVPVPVRQRLPSFTPSDAKITTKSLVPAINSLIDDRTVLITEVGDAVMMSLDITIQRSGGYLCPVFYSTLGYSVPASIGVQAACPDLRPLVLSGDGAFQMTGMEVSTACRYHMNPIVIVLNNSGYGTERPMIDGSFNDVAGWKYHKIPEITGCGKGYLIRTEQEFVDALKEAYTSKELAILDVILDPDDISPQLRRLCQKFSQGVKQ